jgi:hypothetical protein
VALLDREPPPMSNMTPEQIDRHVARMLDHLSRLWLNDDISLAVYEAGLGDLVEWQRRSMTGNGISNDRNPNLKP